MRIIIGNFDENMARLVFCHVSIHILVHRCVLDHEDCSKRLYVYLFVSDQIQCISSITWIHSGLQSNIVRAICLISLYNICCEFSEKNTSQRAAP